MRQSKDRQVLFPRLHVVCWFLTKSRRNSINRYMPDVVKNEWEEFLRTMEKKGRLP